MVVDSVGDSDDDDDDNDDDDMEGWGGWEMKGDGEVWEAAISFE